MNTSEIGRAAATATVTRTQSLRDNLRQHPEEEKTNFDNEMLLKSQRSLSSEKLSSLTHQRISSVRQNGKTTFPMSSPISNNHHSFQIIKTIELSPRTSESAADSEFVKKAKFKPRSCSFLQSGPVLPDHSLKVESYAINVDGKYFSSRPPLSKRQPQEPPLDDTNADMLDYSQIVKNTRSLQFQNHKGHNNRMLRSPTRSIVRHVKSKEINCHNSAEKTEKELEPSNDYLNGKENNFQSDTEARVGRSSLRKNSDSPIYSENVNRNIPSPTKTVKWNPNLSAVKDIPNTSKTSGKQKIKTKLVSGKEEAFNATKSVDNELECTLHNDVELVESHDMFISQCTNLIRNQVFLLGNFRQEKISLNDYQKDLIVQIENQKKLLSDFLSIVTSSVTNDFDL